MSLQVDMRTREVEPALIGSDETKITNAHDAKDQEIAFRMRRKLLGIALGPALLLATLLVPLPLTTKQHHLVAVLVFTMTYWISEALPIPITSILALVLCVLLDVPTIQGTETAAQVTFASFASPTLFLFIGGFIIAQAMVKHGLSKRAALRVLAIPGVAGSPYAVVIALGVLCAAVSSVVANGAVATMMLPIAIGIETSLSKLIRDSGPEAWGKRRLRFGTALMLMVAYGTTVGGLLTPIGDPSNLIGLQFVRADLHTRVSFVRWVVLAAPIVVLLFTVLCIVVLALNRPEVSRIPGARRFVRQERSQLGPMGRGEINTLIVFVLAVCLWVMPSVAGLIMGAESQVHLFLLGHFDASVGAILAATLLFALPVDKHRRAFTLTWDDAAKIDWGTVLLMGAGLTLGKFMSSTGLADVIGQATAHLLGAPSLITVEIIAAATAILISETTSNTASVGIMVPIIPSLTAGMAGGALGPALVAVFAATYGFMLPISTSANAIAYSSGAIPITKMIRTGLVVDLSGIVIIVAGVSIMSKLVGI